MMTFRDFVIVAAIVALVVLWLRRREKTGCGCKERPERPAAPPPAAPRAKRPCTIGGLPC